MSSSSSGRKVTWPFDMDISDGRMGTEDIQYRAYLCAC